MSELYIPQKRVYNCVASAKSPSDYKMYAPLGLFSIPLSVDLSAKCSPVVDQGQLGSCTANAIASGLREYMLINQEKKPLVRLSRLFLYYEERLMEHTVNEDAGADIKDGLSVLKTYGTCREEIDPYDISRFKVPPTKAEITDAKNYRVSNIFALRNLNELKNCLAQGYPVVIGMEVFQQMESEEAASTGIVRMPNSGETPLGGHAVCCVGYQDTPLWKGGGYLKVRNSWGVAWGLKGYFKVSYQYLKSGLIFDLWSAR